MLFELPCKITLETYYRRTLYPFLTLMECRSEMTWEFSNCRQKDKLCEASVGCTRNLFLTTLNEQAINRILISCIVQTAMEKLRNMNDALTCFYQQSSAIQKQKWIELLTFELLLLKHCQLHPASSSWARQKNLQELIVNSL